MKKKNFDCVDLQRSIRDSLWKEAEENPKKFRIIIDNELKNSDLYKFFIKKKNRKDKLQVA